MLAHGRNAPSDRMQGHFVHPFDDDRFISGNGTVGLEIVEDLPDVDAVIAPLGGGGLLAGAAIALKALRPDVKVYAAEPATAAPLPRSFAAGRASYFDRVDRVVRRRRGRQVGARDDVAAPPRRRRRVDRRLARRGRARDGGGRRARARHRRRGGRLRGRGGAVAPDCFEGHRNVVAIVSGGNIDFARFAALVGACA